MLKQLEEKFNTGDYTRAAKYVNMLKAGASMPVHRFREAVGPDLFDDLITDKMNKRLQKAYEPWTSDWKTIAAINKDATLKDDGNHIIRVAEFENIDNIDKTGGHFQDIDVPSDTSISYNVHGYGNIFSLDYKTVQTDDLNAFEKKADKLGKAAGRTFNEWFFSTMIQGNPSADDGNSVFDNTNHSNDLDNGSAGKDLSYANFASVVDKLRTQTGDSGKPLHMRVGYLIVGPKNEPEAYQLMENQYNPDNANEEINIYGPKGSKNLGIQGILVSPYLGTDWYLTAHPEDVELIEIGFHNGQTEPEVYTLDPEVSDTYFRTKQSMWRVELYWGGAYPDWRGWVRGSTNN